MTALDRHIDMPKTRPPLRHRLVALDGTHIRCIDCQQTLDVANLRPPKQPAGTVAPRDPLPEQTCPKHPGEFTGACRSCAADRLERKPDDPPPVSQVRNGADPSTVPEWQAAKAELAAREAQRRRQQRQPMSPPSPTLDTEPQEATP
jgi:hypothetical protein